MHGLAAIPIIAASLCALFYYGELALTSSVVAQNNFATAPTNILSRYTSGDSVIYLNSSYVPATLDWKTKSSNTYDSVTLFGGIIARGSFLGNTTFMRVPHLPPSPKNVTLVSLLQECFRRIQTMYSNGKNILDIIHELVTDEDANSELMNYETIASTYICYRQNDYGSAVCVRPTPRNLRLPWISEMKTSIESALDLFSSGVLFDNRQTILPAPEPTKPITLRMVISQLFHKSDAGRSRNARNFGITIYILGTCYPSLKKYLRTMNADGSSDNGNDDDNVNESRTLETTDGDPQEPASRDLDTEDNDHDYENEPRITELEIVDADPQEPTSKESNGVRIWQVEHKEEETQTPATDETSPLTSDSSEEAFSPSAKIHAKITQDIAKSVHTNELLASEIPSEPSEFEKIPNTLSELRKMRFFRQEVTESSSEESIIQAIMKMDKQVCDNDRQLQRIGAAMKRQWETVIASKQESMNLARSLGNSQSGQICHMFYRFLGRPGSARSKNLNNDDISWILSSIKFQRLAEGDLAKVPGEIESHMKTELAKENLSFTTISIELEFLDYTWELSTSFSLDEGHFLCSKASHDFHKSLEQNQTSEKSVDSKDFIETLRQTYNRFVELQEPFAISIKRATQQLRRIQMMICELEAAYRKYLEIVTPVVEASKYEPTKYTEKSLTEFSVSVDSSRQLERLFHKLLSEA